MPTKLANPKPADDLCSDELQAAERSVSRTGKALARSERSIAKADELIDRSEDAVAAGKALLKKPTGKKAEPLTPAEQRRRFDELSRELGTDNGETLDRVFGKIVPAKVRDPG